MPNIFALNGRATLPRFDKVETALAVAPDAANAQTATRAQLTRVGIQLDAQKVVLQALDIRLQARPTVPEPKTLQELARAGRRRLDEERHKDARHTVQQSTAAVTKLLGALE